MTFFFAFSLVLSLLIAFILFYLILKRLAVNYEMRNKYAISYVVPLLLTLLLIVFIIKDTQLRVVDCVNIYADNRASIELKRSEYSVKGNRIISNYGTYILAPYSNIDSERDYRVLYAPLTHIVLDMEVIGQKKE